MKDGWFQIEFEKNLNSDIHLCEVDKVRLIIIRRNQTLRLYDANCPHRGANLGIGGELHNGFIKCPFHGCSIGLDANSEDGYKLHEYKLLKVSSLLFTNKSTDMGNTGFEKFIKKLNKTHFIIPGFEMEINISPEMVIENAFDQMHFRTVHHILNEPSFEILESRWGEFRVSGIFTIPKSQWQKGGSENPSSTNLDIPYEAIAFSPYLVISQLKGDNPYYIITSARAVAGLTSKVSLSIAISSERVNTEGLPLYKYLISQSQKGLMFDKAIWESLDINAVNKFKKSEKSVIGFRQFVNTF